MSKENPYALPFTQAQLNMLVDPTTSSYFDVGLQWMPKGGEVRAFRDPLEALLVMGGFDLSDTLYALNVAVYRAIDYIHPYDHLTNELKRTIDNRNYFVRGIHDIEWHTNSGGQNMMDFKDWHAVIKIKQDAYTGTAIIHIKGRDLATIERGDNGN